jgi:Ca2+-binding EF-hand superfamily protein
MTDDNFEDLADAMFATMDKDDDGMITFDELKETLEKQPEVLNNLTIG